MKKKSEKVTRPAGGRRLLVQSFTVDGPVWLNDLINLVAAWAASDSIYC